ncbi:GP88 family protein [Sphingomonas jaspsi]|uniref:GP88 family protein n=1 Tax=Sphingomonas jaspsi TaxID=392409 RepID=UPI0004B12750|nr:hypothetical protein [Sphingomonas jaspsi]
MSSLKQLRDRAGLRSLLSRPDANPKVAKNKKVGVLGAVLHLAPGNMSGRETCPKRSPGCSAACLHFAGNPVTLDAKTKSRVAKTDLFFRDRNLFLNLLALEIAAHVRKAGREGMKPGVRLNGTSDIVWEKRRFILFPDVAAKIGRTADNIIDLFPEVSFYDYTKIPGRTPPANYHLTFSESEINAGDVAAEMARGMNIASVFFQELPAQHLGRPVIDGDEHDFRPADPRGVVVGLKAKGNFAKADRSGFVNENEKRTNFLAM